MAITIVFFLLLTASSVALTTSTTLTLQNLCPYPIWPLVTPNSGLPPVAGDTFMLAPYGVGLRSIPLPSSAWAGRVVARTGCNSQATHCDTGLSPPFSVVQLTVHGPGDHAEYSVSLVDGFNVPVTVSPQAIAGGQCPVLGCTVDLNARCPSWEAVTGGSGCGPVACKGPASYFKGWCPNTRTTGSDREALPQSCVAPGELKVIFCPSTMVKAGEEEDVVVRMVVAE